MDQELKNQYPLTSDDLLIHLCVPQIFTRCLPTILCVFFCIDSLFWCGYFSYKFSHCFAFFQCFLLNVYVTNDGKHLAIKSPLYFVKLLFPCYLVLLSKQNLLFLVTVLTYKYIKYQ